MPVYRRNRRRMDSRQNIYGGQLSDASSDRVIGPYTNSYPAGRHSPGDGPYLRDVPRTNGYAPDPRGILGPELYGSSSAGYSRMEPSLPPLSLHGSDAGSMVNSFPHAHEYDHQQAYSVASAMQPNYNDRGYPFPQPAPNQNGSRSYPPSPINGYSYRNTSTDNGHSNGIPPQLLDARSSAQILEPEEYIRAKCKIPLHLPVCLASLEEPPPGTRPNYPYPELVRVAIWSAPEKKLTLKGIYEAIEQRFEWYRKQPDGPWKGSIRHNLSLNNCFVNVNRPLTEPGKGNYWTLDLSKGEGYKRDRKRKPRKKDDEAKRDEDSDGDFNPHPGNNTPRDGHNANAAGPSHSRQSSNRSNRRVSPYTSPSLMNNRPLTPRTNSAPMLSGHTGGPMYTLSASTYSQEFSGIELVPPRQSLSPPESWHGQSFNDDRSLASSPESTGSFTSSHGYDDPNYLPSSHKGKSRS